MTGTLKEFRMQGRMTSTDKDGKKTIWVWDFHENKARIEGEMTKEQFVKSEKAKYNLNI